MHCVRGFVPRAWSSCSWPKEILSKTVSGATHAVSGGVGAGSAAAAVMSA